MWGRIGGRMGRGLTRVVCGVVALPVVGSGLGGCVAQREYDRLWETNRSLENQVGELNIALDDCRSKYDALSGSGAGASEAIARLQRENSELRGQLERAGGALTDLERRMGGLNFGRLDPATDLALSRLAAQYPDLIQYDAERGMLRFASDLTFRSGSDEVEPRAREVLGRLAQILRTPDASAYDAIIVGHTDSQRISARTAQRHPTNMHLSAHRAISVRRVLGEQGVPWEKMQAAGWGEFRPRVQNTASGNTPENRRVEVFLAESTATGTVLPASSGGPVTTTAPAVDRERGAGAFVEPVK
jgi:chemotaxis protein MotB